MLTAGGRGERARRRELELVVARCVTSERDGGGVWISNCSSSDLSLSCERMGVCGEGETARRISTEFASALSHGRGVSGVAVRVEGPSDTS